MPDSAADRWTRAVITPGGGRRRGAARSRSRRPSAAAASSEASSTSVGAGTSAATSQATSDASATTTTGSTTTGIDSTSAADPSSGSTLDPSTTTAGEETSTTTGELPSTCPDDPALRLCYSFEGAVSTIIVDSSASNHSGIAVGAEKGGGHPGDGLLLSAKSVVRVPDDGKIFETLADSFTLAAWIAPEVDLLPSESGVVSRPGHFEMTLVRAGGGVRLHCSVLGSESLSGSLSLTEWTHVACRYDGMMITTIVNGEAVGQSDVTQQALVPHDLFLGNLGPEPSSSDAYVGLLDEVQVWSVALGDAALCAYAGLMGCT
ncbi:MAG: LamG domain-containing protein [Nannocystaceae bacterium]